MPPPRIKYFDFMTSPPIRSKGYRMLMQLAIRWREPAPSNGTKVHRRDHDAIDIAKPSVVSSCLRTLARPCERPFRIDEQPRKRSHQAKRGSHHERRGPAESR